jgi:hypothetical protein
MAKLNACSNSAGYRPKNALLNMGRLLSLGVYKEMNPYGNSLTESRVEAV